MTDFPIIDAHHHFWDLGMNKNPWLNRPDPIPFRYGDYSAIRRNFLVEDYLAATQGYDVVKTVHMEAEWDPSDPVGETAWLHSLHDKTGYPHALIGQAWFGREDIKAVLEGHAAYPLTRSVRQKPAATPSPDAFRPGLPGSMADPTFRDGYRLLSQFGLHYDLQTPWWHLDEAAALARDFPDTMIILNHTGLPADRSAAGIAGWREAMETFAAQPNTVVKISGIGVPGERWTAALNRDVVLEAIRIFGPDRAMFASNYPVDSLCGTFGEIFSGFKEIVRDLPDAEQRALFHDTANRIYRPV